VAQISNSFRPIFSAAERFALEPEGEMDIGLPEEHEYNGFSHFEWHQLLSSFSNVKTRRIDNPFVEGVFVGVELAMHLLHSSMLARRQVAP
jgi:hypothetical protein